jgi:hypothetical protein
MKPKLSGESSVGIYCGMSEGRARVNGDVILDYRRWERLDYLWDPKRKVRDLEIGSYATGETSHRGLGKRNSLECRARAR